MINLCRDCGWLPTGGQCPFFKREVPYEQTACPNFTTKVITCSICGRAIPSAAIIDCCEDGNHYLCSNCYSALGTCSTCKHGTGCAFQTDTSCQEQLYIMAQKRQGNMVIQQQVLNPKRVEATCAKGCPCHSTTSGCLRGEGCTCELYATNRKE